MFDIADDAQAQAKVQRDVEPILTPILPTLYARRAAFCDKEAARASQAYRPWWQFLHKLTSAQQSGVEKMAAEHMFMRPQGAHDRETFAQEIVRRGVYFPFLDFLYRHIASILPENVSAALETFLTQQETLRAFAEKLLSYDYNAAQAGLALIVRAALSSYMAVYAASLKAQVAPPFDHLCPICKSLPSGTVIAGGVREGLRYVQCSLCETRWHKVRGVCLICHHTGRMDIWDEKDDFSSSCEVESCGDCHFYSKAIRRDRIATLDLVCEDLTSEKMDQFMRGEGYYRFGVNPFALPVLG